MLKFGNKLIDVAKFWIYWIIVVTLTIGLFFALLENAHFEGEDMKFYLAHKDTLRYNCWVFAVISFVLTYVLANPLINRLYKNNTLSFGKRLLWQTLIYFLILIMIMVLFTL
jgi:hypothetical protein